MDLLNAKTIHFVGIGGIGVSAVARFFVARGATVSGSDRANFDQAKELRDHGIKVFTKHSEKNLPKNCEAVVYSSAVPKENPELSLAHSRNIPMFEYAAALGEIMKEKYGIGVSGTNGKTTTTAMLGKILEEAKLDPMVIIGGKVPGWDANLRLPKLHRTTLCKHTQGSPVCNLFVAEACEYHRHFLNLAPKTIVLTNIEPEHLDYFKDIEDIKDAFSVYVSKLPKDGFLIYNADDKNVSEVIKRSPAKKVSCSLKKNADFRASNVRYEKGKQFFEVDHEGKKLGTFSVAVPGEFNIYNSLEALACAMTFGAKPEQAKAALAKFAGTWRRFQKVGKVGKTLVISDYAHHPAGVSATVKAAKELYPDKKILFVFQPHQKDRTLKLLDEFADAFSGAEHIIFSEIYEVSGRNEVSKKVSSEDLAVKIKGADVVYSPSVKDTQKLVKSLLPDFDVVVIMGAGDIYIIAENLVQ